MVLKVHCYSHNPDSEQVTFTHTVAGLHIHTTCPNSKSGEHQRPPLIPIFKTHLPIPIKRVQIELNPLINNNIVINYYKHHNENLHS